MFCFESKNVIFTMFLSRWHAHVFYVAYVKLSKMRQRDMLMRRPEKQNTYRENCVSWHDAAFVPDSLTNWSGA